MFSKEKQLFKLNNDINNYLLVFGFIYILFSFSKTKIFYFKFDIFSFIFKIFSFNFTIITDLFFYIIVVLYNFKIISIISLMNYRIYTFNSKYYKIRNKNKENKNNITK